MLSCWELIVWLDPELTNMIVCADTRTYWRRNWGAAGIVRKIWGSSE